MKNLSLLLVVAFLYSFCIPQGAGVVTKANQTLQDTVPMLLTVTDTIVVFDYETYEETFTIVQSEVFNPDYFLQEKFMRDTIMTIDTIVSFDPKTHRETMEIFEMRIPKGVQHLLNYEYDKEVPDFDNVQRYLDMCKKKKIK